MNRTYVNTTIIYAILSLCYYKQVQKIKLNKVSSKTFLKSSKAGLVRWYVMFILYLIPFKRFMMLVDKIYKM